MEEDEDDTPPPLPKKPGAPKTKAEHGIHLRLKPELEARLDAWIKRQSIPTNRANSVRILLERALEIEESKLSSGFPGPLGHFAK